MSELRCGSTPFDKILEAVKNEVVDAGLLIHEGQLCFRNWFVYYFVSRLLEFLSNGVNYRIEVRLIQFQREVRRVFNPGTAMRFPAISLASARCARLRLARSFRQSWRRNRARYILSAQPRVCRETQRVRRIFRSEPLHSG